MKTLNVVTSFIINSGELLILKRSNKVSSMCGLWSAISGRLEQHETPITRAKQEIWEEIGLANDQIKLLKIGTVTNIYNRDDDYIRSWSIHPFLFQTNTKKIKLNWENSSYLWIFPNSLTKFITVPQLHQIFISVIHHF